MLVCLQFSSFFYRSENIQLFLTVDEAHVGKLSAWWSHGSALWKHEVTHPGQSGHQRSLRSGLLTVTCVRKLT